MTQPNIFEQESFFNTTKETGKALAIYSDIAKKQDIKVLRFFQTHAGRSFTAHEVYKALSDDNSPLTSYRRSITNLTDEERLVYTKVKRMGHLGRMTSTWKLNVK